MLNIHPGLLPAFGGKGLYGLRVHKAVIASGARFSGATVHFVDEEYDTGPILAQAMVHVSPHDTPQMLAARVLQQVTHCMCCTILCSQAQVELYTLFSMLDRLCLSPHNMPKTVYDTALSPVHVPHVTSVIATNNKTPCMHHWPCSFTPASASYRVNEESRCITMAVAFAQSMNGTPVCAAPGKLVIRVLKNQGGHVALILCHAACK